MNYTRIRARVTDQGIQLVNVPLIASGGQNEIRVEFTFCTMWDSCTKTAVFYRDPEKVYHVLMTDDSAVVPAEVLAEDGLFYFGVFGTREDQVRTTEVISVTVVKGAVTFKAIEPGEPTPDIYQQILSAYNELVSLEGNAAVIRVKDTNGGRDVTFWIGTRAQYEALDAKATNCFYVITDDPAVADHITYYWEDVDFRHHIRKYANGCAEAFCQGRWENMSFTTEHNGFYAYDAGRVRVGLEEILQGVIPDMCSVHVTKVTKINDAGEEVFGPPMMAMVCGETENLENYGVVSPRILLLADESAIGVNLEIEVHCRWKWDKGESGA